MPITIKQLPSNILQIKQRILGAISFINLMLFLVLAFVFEFNLLWVVLILPLSSIFLYWLAKKIWIKPDQAGLIFLEDKLILFDSQSDVTLEVAYKNLVRVDFLNRPTGQAMTYNDWLLLTSTDGRRDQYLINHLENFNKIRCRNIVNAHIAQNK